MSTYNANIYSVPFQWMAVCADVDSRLDDIGSGIQHYQTGVPQHQWSSTIQLFIHGETADLMVQDSSNDNKNKTIH